ncbi:MAG: arylesterase [Pseudomonadota bacterium]
MGATRPASRSRLVRREAIVACLLLCCVLAACESNTPPIAPLGPNAVIVAFGDSLTFGTGAEPEQSYPARLASALSRTVVNAGVPGEVTAEGLRRLPSVLERDGPALVVLCHGGNDILRKVEPSETERNLRQMIEQIRASGAAVVMLGVPERSLFLGTAEVYERVAEDLEVPIDGDIIGDLLGDNAKKSDPIHPNALGYAALADAVEGLLRKTGAIR